MGKLNEYINKKMYGELNWSIENKDEYIEFPSTDENRKRIYSGRYALSGMVFCAHCGDIFRRIKWNFLRKVSNPTAFAREYRVQSGGRYLKLDCSD